MGIVRASLSAGTSAGWPLFSEHDALERCVHEVEALSLADGLPVVPPTAARMERMLAGVAEPETIRGEVAPLAVPLTVERVAYNAVLAGCSPNALDVVFTAVTAALEPEFNLLGIQTTTGTTAITVILHGEAVLATGANAGTNCLGPGNRANATIGRAVQLALRNIGGATPGVIDMATIGQPGKYTFCFAERADDQLLPPLPQRLGLRAPAGAVSVAGVSGTTEVAGTGMTADELVESLAAAVAQPGGIAFGANLFGGGEQVILVPPEISTRLVTEGWTVERLQQAIHGRGATPAGDTTVEVATSPKDVHLIAAGGTGEKLSVLPTWAGGTRMVTRAVAPLASGEEVRR